MTCFSPLHAYKSSIVNKETGKNRLIFVNKSEANKRDDVFTVPCGQCIGCRIDKSRDWATRIVLENELHDDGIFLTLTYDDEHLPSDQGLVKDEISVFMKNLRRQLKYHYGIDGIRFFGCGEYGDDMLRPHYHVIIFGWRPKDRIRYKDDLYTSPFLEKIWKKGWCPFGSITYESAAYVARYVCKKVTGPIADYWYDGLQPEFVVMSRRPGIGFDWLEKYQADVLRDDYIIVGNGRKCKVPKYFDRIFEDYYPQTMEEIKERRIIKSKEQITKDCKERGFLYREGTCYSFEQLERDFYEYHVLPVKKDVCKGKYKMYKRGFENGSY